MSTDAIVLLKDDHKETKRTFDAFEKAGENAHKEKGRLVAKMIELLDGPEQQEQPRATRTPS